jgi:RNA polymerase sigma-70 factor (ECF subfamily)
MTKATTTTTSNLKFEDVYNEYKPLIEYFLRNKIKNEEVREDIVAMTFIKVAKHLEAYQPEKSKLSTWIHLIANRLVIDEYRKNNATISTTDLSSNDGTIAFEFIGEDSADSTIDNKELHRNIRRAIRTLKPTEKHISILRFVKEYEYSEIAEILDMPLNSVKVTIMRAKESLQSALRNEYAML